jgi:hypothetical protein
LGEFGLPALRWYGIYLTEAMSQARDLPDGSAFEDWIVFHGRSKGPFTASIRLESFIERLRESCGEPGQGSAADLERAEAAARRRVADWALSESPPPPPVVAAAPKVTKPEPPPRLSPEEQAEADAELGARRAIYEETSEDGDEDAWLVAWVHATQGRAHHRANLEAAALLGYEPIRRALGADCPPLLSQSMLESPTLEEDRLLQGLLGRESVAGRLGLVVGALALKTLPPTWAKASRDRALDDLVAACRDPSEELVFAAHESAAASRYDLANYLGEVPAHPLFQPENRAALGAFRCASWGGNAMQANRAYHAQVFVSELLAEAALAGLSVATIREASVRLLVPWLLEVWDPATEQDWRSF